MFIYHIMGDRGGFIRAKVIRPKFKNIVKEMRSSILVRYLIVGEIWLHDFGGIACYYLSGIQFELLSSGYTTESRLGMVFFTWYTVN